ncbi:hypothetical protein ES703_60568 [subsurface metagenome]
MSNIPYLPGTSQVLLFIFDFKNNIVHVFIIFHNQLVEAVGFKKTFDRVEVWPWIKNEVDPDREVTYLVLDCKCSDDHPLRIDILPGLLELMNNVDHSSIRFTIQGHEGSPWAPFGWDDINFIAVYALLQENCFPFIEDDKLVIKMREESETRGFTDGYTPHGGGKPERKAKKETERKKPDLYIVHEEKGKVIKLKKRHQTPKDLLKLLKTERAKKSSVLVFKAIDKAFWYSHSTKLWMWHEPKHRFGRWFTGGNESLMNMTGLSRWTVSDALAELKAVGVIYLRHRGYPGEGNSIWELAFDMNHVNAWKRKPKGSK